MELIKVRALFKINEGQLDTFKALKQQLISVVKEKEKGTLMYDWYVNEDAMECAILRLPFALSRDGVKVEWRQEYDCINI